MAFFTSAASAGPRRRMFPGPQRLRGALALAALLAASQPGGRRAVLTSSCWYGQYDEHLCCVVGNPDCWDAVFTEEKCCPNKTTGERPRTRGNPRCWIDGYSYEDCCEEEPKVGCWDDTFGPETCCVDTEPEAPDRPVNITEEEYESALTRLLGLATVPPLGCRDSPRGLWGVVKTLSVLVNVTRSYGMPPDAPPDKDMKMLVRHVREWTRNVSAWEEAKATCPAGALNAIDMCASVVDSNYSEAEAKAAYVLRESLLGELAEPSGPQPASDWPVLAAGYEYPPRLLGLTEPHACHGTKLRIFMYDVAPLSHMTKPVLACSQKMSMCAASVQIHRWLLSGGCLTSDPDQADLFYVPAYESCYNATACGYDNNTQRCFPPSFNPASDLPYWSRRGGADHVFVWACNLLAFSDQLMIQTRQSIMVTVESFQAENNEPYKAESMLAWLSHWKDVLIPGYIPRWRIMAMLAHNRPVMKRTLLIGFHGHYSRNPMVGHIYKRSPLAEIRTTIIDHFWNMSSCSVGPPVTDYFRRMGLSRFCLVPAGLTAWTLHLYEAFFFGCIPVILSDELTMPFQDEVDWPSLSIKVPTTMPMEELHLKLQGFSIGRTKAMYRALAEARCWFDYSGGWGAEGNSPSGCSPYRGLLRGLEERARSGAAKLYGKTGAYWEPPPSTD